VNEAEGQSIWHQATGTAAITTAGFATFIEPLVMLAYALWRAGGPETNKTWTIFVAAVGAVVTVLTLNRSSWIGILVGLGTVEMMLRARGFVPRYALNWRMLAVVAGIACLFLTAMPLLAGKRQQDNYSDWIQRFDLMRPAIRMITKNPVFGVGPGVYGYVVGGYAYGLWQAWLFIVHNDYLLCWAERGTIGFIALFLFLRTAVRLTRSASRSAEPALGVLGVGIFGGLIVHMWEVFWTQSMSFPVYGLLWMLLAILVAGRPLLEGAGSAAPARAAA
jgi:O-antigen ligase